MLSEKDSSTNARFSVHWRNRYKPELSELYSDIDLKYGNSAVAGSYGANEHRHMYIHTMGKVEDTSS